ITLAEPAEEITLNIAGFGWTLSDLDLLDLAPSGEPEASVAGEYHVFPPSEVEQGPLWQTIYQAVREKRPQRVVIDSATQLRYLSTDEYQFRKQMLHLVRFLNRQGCTTLLIFEPTELDREASVALAVDGIIRLRQEISPGRVIGLRSVQVEKLRGSDFMSGLHPMRFTEQGLVVFPHHIEEPGLARPGGECLSSGLPPLDLLLGGGLESGTSTIISGPTGVGKSSLGLHFLITAARAGKRVVLYTFEEPVASILARSQGLGMPIDDLLASGTLSLLHVNPLQLYPDEFLMHIRKQVEEGRQVVMLDSLRGYGLAMEQFGVLTAHLQNLVAYCHRQGVSIFLINEVEHITGDLVLSELGISYLVDNAILLRYAEVEGRVIRVIGCLKKRLGNFQPELREIRITVEGVQVGEKLEGLHGVLTGIPVRAR
ncbi:MAG: recombinase RecA, partial [Nitrospinota bacterium]